MEKKKKIYVVTSGCYSGYHIVAVFTHKKLAEEFADKDTDRTIEVYNADDAVIDDYEHYFEVDIYTDPDKELCARSAYWLGLESIKYNREEHRYYHEYEHYTFVVKADGIKKAKAIALERYHAFLAIKDTHFPFIQTNCVMDGYNDFGETPFYGYFDYKIYIPKKINHEVMLERLSPLAPIPFAEPIDIFQNDYDDEEVMDMLNAHGISIDYFPEDK